MLKKILRNLQKATLEFAACQQHFHNIYIVLQLFPSIYIVLGITSNLEMI